MSSRCLSAFNWDSFRTSKTNIPSEISQDEFMGQRIHLGWTCLTNSSGYEFIDWDLAGRIHQGRNLAWRIHGATNSYSETWQDEFIKWGISPDESIGLRIHQCVLAWWIHRATDSSREILAGRIHPLRNGRHTRSAQPAIRPTRPHSHDPPRDGNPLNPH